MQRLFLLVTLAGCGGYERDLARYCELELSCDDRAYADEAACVDEVRGSPFDVAGEDCVEAEQARVRCLSKLAGCGELGAYWSEAEADYPCAAEDAEVAAACE